jgi:hypothetical protein
MQGLIERLGYCLLSSKLAKAVNRAILEGQCITIFRGAVNRTTAAINGDRSHIGGDYIGRDKAGGDIAGRDIYKAQANLTINQNQTDVLKEIITELRKIQSQSELSTEQKEELEAEIQTIENQAKSPKPKVQIIKNALSSAKELIEQGSGVASAAAPLIARIASWLSGIP